MFFRGTPHAIKRCPRMVVDLNPDIGDVLALWRTCDGQPGISALRQLSSHALEGMAVVDAARAVRQRQEQQDAVTKAKAEAGRA